MCDRDEIDVEWDEWGGIYEAYDHSYLCGHCRGRLHSRITHGMTRTINLREAFLKSSTPSYEEFVAHMPISVAKTLYSWRTWAEECAEIKHLMDAVEATSEDKQPPIQALCDYLTTQRTLLTVKDGLRTIVKTKFADQPAATSLLALIADIEAHP